MNQVLENQASPQPRDLIKAATSEHHKKLDAMLSTLNLRDPPDYITFLKVNTSVLANLEAAVELASTSGFGWNLVRRSDLAQRDLELMDTSQPFLLPVQPFDEGEVWGALYVLEGSRLGSRLMLQSLLQGVGGAPVFPCHFLQASADISKWKAFVQELNCAVQTPSQVAQALSGAIKTFKLFTLSAQLHLTRIPREDAKLVNDPVKQKTLNTEALTPDHGLTGHGLLVEDNFVIMMDLEDMLLGAGADKIDQAINTRQAMKLLDENTYDFAILDYNLGSETSIDIARRLKAENVLFAFATGYGDALELPPDMQSPLIFSKPFSKSSLSRLINEMAEKSRNST